MVGGISVSTVFGLLQILVVNIMHIYKYTYEGLHVNI